MGRYDAFPVAELDGQTYSIILDKLQVATPINQDAYTFYRIRYLALHPIPDNDRMVVFRQQYFGPDGWVDYSGMDVLESFQWIDGWMFRELQQETARFTAEQQALLRKLYDDIGEWLHRAPEVGDDDVEAG